MKLDPDEIEPDEEVEPVEEDAEPEVSNHDKKLNVIFIPPGATIDYTY